MQNQQLAATPLTNPLAFTGQSQQPSALVQIESSRAIQEVQAALVIAKRFPRDQLAATERIRNACTRPTLANVAVYQYARGGTDITGPSIRLAEAIAQQWGNLTFGFTELEQAGGASTCEAFCWDLETNTKRSVTFQVPHERHTKRGVTALTDPRDIYELVANNASRRVRACILATIPGDVVEAALEQCDETMRATADTSPKAQLAILATFEKFGVSKDQIEKRIQKRLDAITPAQVVALRKIVSSMRDGMSKPDEWFDAIIPSANVPPNNSASETAAAGMGVPATVDAAAGRVSRARQQPSEPARESLVMGSTPAPSVSEQMLAACARDGVTWEEVAESAVRNSALAAVCAVEDANIADLQNLLAHWDAVVADVKGGQQ